MSLVMDAIYFYVGVMPLMGGIISLLFTLDNREYYEKSPIKRVYSRLKVANNEKIYFFISSLLFYSWLAGYNIYLIDIISFIVPMIPFILGCIVLNFRLGIIYEHDPQLPILEKLENNIYLYIRKNRKTYILSSLSIVILNLIVRIYYL